LGFCAIALLRRQTCSLLFLSAQFRGLDTSKLTSQKNQSNRLLISSLIVAVLFAMATISKGEDGYRLWLRYDQLPRQALAAYRTHVTQIVVVGHSPGFDAIRTELVNGCNGLLNAKVTEGIGEQDGAIIAG